jgi:hypothetical protein
MEIEFIAQKAVYGVATTPDGRGCIERRRLWIRRLERRLISGIAPVKRWGLSEADLVASFGFGRVEGAVG